MVESFADIQPIPQNDGPNPVVVINYEASYRGLMDIFRGVVHVGEKSERVLTLTENILSANPANYTVWQYRRDCLRELNYNLDDEFDYMDSFADDNPKSYQIWYHRRAIVEMSGDASRELEFCARVFEVDGKNYHAWAHRQWVLLTFKNWDYELELIEHLLDKDIRNNSAWNQRWFFVHKGPHNISPEVLSREIDFAFESIKLVSLNESAWNYLRGLFKTHTTDVQQIILSRLVTYVLGNGSNTHALGLLADIKESEMTSAALLEASDVLEKLASLDRIRCKYWKKRVERVANLLEYSASTL